MTENGGRDRRNPGARPGPRAHYARRGAGRRYRPRCRAGRCAARERARGARRSTWPSPNDRDGLAGLGTVDRLALAALDRDLNTVADYDIARRSAWSP